ncbi:hypothetical protein RB653_010073 [Dictyostelium firmibasis]|uniref:Glutathione S-transferase n=1 Tax=Dictyostelium firmibasis TaxID=79012 RepID=A0AAN7YKP7_9MYCE
MQQNKFDFTIINDHKSSNNYKVELMLIELGVSYESISINDYLKNNSNNNNNNRIPALIDNTFKEANILYESGSVLIYLANRFSKFLPDFRLNATQQNNNSQIISKSVWQLVNLISSNTNNENEVKTVLKLLDDRLSTNQYLGGSQYSIADISNSVWLLHLLKNSNSNQIISRFSNIIKWLELINQRESFKKLNNLMNNFNNNSNNNNSFKFSNDLGIAINAL